MTHAERALIWCELVELYNPDDAMHWLNEPHPQLNDRRAADCAFDEVMAIIDQLKSGAFI